MSRDENGDQLRFRELELYLHSPEPDHSMSWAPTESAAGKIKRTKKKLLGIFLPRNDDKPRLVDDLAARRSEDRYVHARPEATRVDLRSLSAGQP